MATIAVLGMGLLGSGFAENLLRKGHTVRVWNRTAERCAPLVALGALQAQTPAEAVQGAARVHLILSADDAVDSVITQLRPALGGGVPLLDHSTNLPARVAHRVSALRAEGIGYLHAPVFMGPRNSREGTGLMLICGPEAEITALRPALEAMTGTLLSLGERPDKAAAIKLIGNSVLLMMTASMGDAFALGQHLDIEPHEIIALFTAFGPTPAGMGQRVLDSDRLPVGFEMTMARKDAGLMLAAAGAGTLRLLPVIAAALDDAIAAGRGAEDFTAIARPPRPPRPPQ